MIEVEWIILFRELPEEGLTSDIARQGANAIKSGIHDDEDGSWWSVPREVW